MGSVSVSFAAVFGLKLWCSGNCCVLGNVLCRQQCATELELLPRAMLLAYGILCLHSPAARDVRVSCGFSCCIVFLPWVLLVVSDLHPAAFQ